MNTGNANIGEVQCLYCLAGTFHLGAVCPRIKAIEYYLDGTIKRIEFRDEK